MLGLEEGWEEAQTRTHAGRKGNGKACYGAKTPEAMTASLWGIAAPISMKTIFLSEKKSPWCVSGNPEVGNA